MYDKSTEGLHAANNNPTPTIIDHGADFILVKTVILYRFRFLCTRYGVKIDIFAHIVQQMMLFYIIRFKFAAPSVVNRINRNTLYESKQDFRKLFDMSLYFCNSFRINGIVVLLQYRMRPPVVMIPGIVMEFRIE